MPDAPSDALALSDLSSAIVAMVRAMDDFRLESRQLSGISATELRILGRIAERPGTTPGELATDLGLTSGAITAATTHLVDLGLIDRRESPTDRRRLQLTLLAPAHEQLAGRYREVDARIARAAAALTAAERARVASFLTAAARALRGERADQD